MYVPHKYNNDKQGQSFHRTATEKILTKREISNRHLTENELKRHINNKTDRQTNTEVRKSTFKR